MICMHSTHALCRGPQGSAEVSDSPLHRRSQSGARKSPERESNTLMRVSLGGPAGSSLRTPEGVEVMETAEGYSEAAEAARLVCCFFTLYCISLRTR
jgi:hypothetical protein